jgi:integrase/recombinase XerD
MHVDSAQQDRQLVLLPNLQRLPAILEVLDGVFVKYLQQYVADGAPSEDTVRCYRHTVKQFVEWCLVHNINPLSVTEAQMVQYRAELRQRYATGSVAYKIAVLRRYFDAMIEAGYRTDNPLRRVRVRPDDTPDERPLKVLAEDSLQRLVDALPSPKTETGARDALIVLLMVLHGLRVIEVVRLDLEDVQLDGDTVRLYVRGKYHGRTVYLRPDVVTLLNRYLELRGDGGGALFLARAPRNNGGRLSRRRVRRIVDDILQRAGLKTTRLSCHALRHTAATLGYKYTRDIRVVQDWLGHRSPETTARYVHLVERAENSPARKIPVRLHLAAET